MSHGATKSTASDQDWDLKQEQEILVKLNKDGVGKVFYWQFHIQNYFSIQVEANANYNECELHEHDDLKPIGTMNDVHCVVNVVEGLSEDVCSFSYCNGQGIFSGKLTEECFIGGSPGHELWWIQRVSASSQCPCHIPTISKAIVPSRLFRFNIGEGRISC